MFSYACSSFDGRAGNMKEVYVTLSLNPSPRERDLPSLRSITKFMSLFMFSYTCSSLILATAKLCKYSAISIIGLYIFIDHSVDSCNCCHIHNILHGALKVDKVYRFVQSHLDRTYYLHIRSKGLKHLVGTVR